MIHVANIFKFIFFSLLISLLVLICACAKTGTENPPDNSKHKTSDAAVTTGAISFRMVWAAAPGNLTSMKSLNANIGCENISNVRALIYEGNTMLKEIAQLPCESTERTIDEIPVGPDRTVVIVGEDAHGDIIYSGSKTGIEINAGAITAVGNIVVDVFIPSPGNTAALLGTNEADIGESIAIDSRGNRYVAGYTYGQLSGQVNSGGADAFVSKINSHGEIQWTKMIGSSSDDFCTGIAVDFSGNAYITGHTSADMGEETNSGGDDIFVSKIDSNGEVVWTKLFGTEEQDFGLGIAVNSTSEVYITGCTFGNLGGASKGNSDAIVVKMSSEGLIIWKTIFGTQWHDRGNCIAIDAQGNACVTGTSSAILPGKTANEGDPDILVAKLDPLGNLLWNKFMGTESEDNARSIKVDSAGNIYVAGSTEGNLGGVNSYLSLGFTDLFVSKLNANGETLWIRQLGTETSDENAKGITLDPAGNIYVTGSTTGNMDGIHTTQNGEWMSSDIFIIRLDETGQIIWTKQIGSDGDYSDYASAIASDSAGHLFVAGSTLGDMGGDIANLGNYDIFVRSLCQDTND